MSQFLQFVFSGLTVGAIYSLVALGFNIIYNASDVMNFAQGEFVMIGGIATFVLYSAGVPLVLAAFLAIALASIVGILLYRLAIWPARDASPVVLIIITIGASIFIRELSRLQSTSVSIRCRRFQVTSRSLSVAQLFCRRACGSSAAQWRLSWRWPGF